MTIGFGSRVRLAKASSLLGCAGAILAFSSVSPAATTPASSPGTRVSDLALAIQRTTLENGLRVVMNVDHTSPSVAVAVTYDVGSRNEIPGRSGFAHLFEHMMFQGSGHVAKGEHFKLITARGGTLNGTTSTDRTNYFEMLPSSELPLALWLEGDRMKSLAVNPTNVENQRAVVEEEYRMRVSNQAYAEGFIRLRALVFDGYFPYEHDTIGSMADLDAAKFEYVAAFHEAYYAPNNAVLALSGDFDADEAMNLVRANFGDAPRKNVPAYSPPPFPPQTAPRHADIVDTNAKTDALLQGWAIPENRTPEHYALELAALILGDGESSRLYQRLVRGDAKAQSVSAWTNDQRGPDMFGVRAVLTERAKLPDVQRIVQTEIDKLGAEGPTEAELEKAKTRFASQFVFGIESNLHRATELAEYELFWGDARLLSRELEHYQAVTGIQLRDAVKKYLAKGVRSTVHVFPPGTEADQIVKAQPTPAGSSALPGPDKNALCGGP